MPRHFIQTEEEREENYLAHYGIKGMKWGKRTGGLGARTDGAQMDRIHNQKEIIKRARAGKGTLEEKVANAPARILLGKKRFDKMLDKTMGQLEDREKRVAAGKRNLGDKLDVLLNTRAIDLVVSRRDNKTNIANDKAAAKVARKAS